MFGVGYEGRTLDDLVALLVANGVEVLVDVRENAVSRKPGLSKQRLGEALGEVEIVYRHEPTLGNPRDNRDAFRRGSAEARARYLAHVDEGGGDALARVVALVGEGRVALLCFERDEEQCHRGCVIERVVAEAPGVEVVRL